MSRHFVQQLTLVAVYQYHKMCCVLCSSRLVKDPDQVWTGTEKRPGTLKRRPAHDRVLLLLLLYFALCSGRLTVCSWSPDSRRPVRPWSRSYPEDHTINCALLESCRSGQYKTQQQKNGWKKQNNFNHATTHPWALTWI